MGHAGNGFNDGGEIEHRLPHSHENNRLQSSTNGGGVMSQMKKLVDDLPRGEIGDKAIPRGGTKITPHCTADLR